MGANSAAQRNSCVRVPAPLRNVRSAELPRGRCAPAEGNLVAWGRNICLRPVSSLLNRVRENRLLAERGCEGAYVSDRISLIARVRTVLHQNLIGFVRLYYNRFWGTSIGTGSRISLSAKIDKTNPAGVIIGKHSALAFDAAILTHDFINGRMLETRIGDYCFIGARAIIMPGVEIGNHCIVASGAVVMKNVPSHSVVMGNPGRVIEGGILTGQLGRRVRDVTELTRPEEQGIIVEQAHGD